jgi:hypothetical protein
MNILVSPLRSIPAVLEMGWYTIPEILFVPELLTGTYQYTIYLSIFFHFYHDTSLSAYKKYAGTPKFPFRALLANRNII